MANSSVHEYTAYLTTQDALPKLNEADNPTNNVTIPCRFPQRLNVAQITLGSLEMPLTQYNIEDDWQTLYFDEGLDLLVINPMDEPLLQLTIDENGTEVTAQLPPKLNPIIEITPTGSNTKIATFTTQYPHQLALRGFFNWGEPMRVIGTPLLEPTYQDVIELTESNPYLTILSETQFQLAWPSLANVLFNLNTSGILGYVSTPSIPSPVYLASLVTQAMNLVAPNRWTFTYNPCDGKFKICYTGSICDLNVIFPATLIVPNGTNNLPHIMGFGCVSVAIPPPASDYKGPSLLLVEQNRPRELPNIQNNCLVSVECSPCRSQVEIDVGNYDPNGLMSNLSRQLNRFYFDPGCNLTASSGASTTATPINFVFSNTCGQCITVVIPFGMYSPDNLATYLQSQMVSQIPSIQVTFDINAGQFSFIAESDFGLEFDVGSQELAFRLGFYPISYRNENAYKSTLPFFYPTKGCCGTSIPDRHLSYVYSPLVQGSQRKFIVQISKPRCIQNVGAIVNNGDGTITITTTLPGPTPIAHGYQVMDVIEITVAGTTYYLVVTQVNAFNVFVAEVGSINPTVFAGQNVCLCLDSTIASNFYFSCQSNNVLARTLGYTECDALWDPLVPTTKIAPACFMLDWPQYVLLELTEPTGATRNMHAWRDSPDHIDTQTNIMAKCILYPAYRLERHFPLTLHMPQLNIVNRVHIRILNPDHSLYRLHGRNFSFTLVFAAVEKSIQQLCY